jgi:hypothetical protein
MNLQEQVKKILNEKSWIVTEASLNIEENFHRQMIDKIHKLQFLIELLAKAIDESKR